MRRGRIPRGAGSLVLLGLVVLVVVRGDEPVPESERERPGESAQARVLRVVDGDTIEAEFGGEVEDVRYIGVDTPESVAPGEPVECFGPRAAGFNRRLVEGRSVRLVFDRERRDHYGRLLAYVYVDGTLVNAELVRQGFAQTLTIPPNDAHAERLTRLEMAAARAGRGLWGACAP